MKFVACFLQNFYSNLAIEYSNTGRTMSLLEVVWFWSSLEASIVKIVPET